MDCCFHVWDIQCIQFQVLILCEANRERYDLWYNKNKNEYYQLSQLRTSSGSGILVI